MLRIPCPWCGERDETEFAYGGEAHVAHPARPEDVSDEAWGRYLFVRANPAGEWDERWCHIVGCRRWFTIRRDTTTNAILAEAPDAA